jgi:radical SAM superfamily enzyme YgiQ (UPF0313 family)
MPRFELLEPTRYARFTVQTQRGCPFDCEFCAASVRLSRGFKVKPVEKVLAEIRRIRDLFDMPNIEFADDNTFANPAHSRRLMQALAGEGIRWFTETDIGFADDPELIELAARAGCVQVLIGLEGVSPIALNGVEKKANWKARRVDTYLDSIARIQDRGISVNGCFILGLDGTTEHSFDEILAFIDRSGLAEVQLTVLTPFPGTPLYDRLLAEGRILRPGAWDRCTLFDVNFVPDGMSVDQLDRGLRALAREVYGEARTHARRRLLGAQWRKRPAYRKSEAEHAG